MEISAQLREEINLRQKGMCGQCGKKFDEIDGTIEKIFLPLSSTVANNPSMDTTVLICNYCNNENKVIIPDINNYNMKKYHFIYAGFESYTLEQKIEDFRDEVNVLFESLKQSTDIRDSRNKINEKIKFLKALALGREAYEEFNTKLSAALDEINQKQRQEFEKLDQEQITNYNSIKEKVEEAIQETENIVEFKTAREKLISVQTEMNSLTLKREHKDELVQKFNIAFQNLNKRQSEEWEKYEMEYSENYLNLKKIVEEAVIFAADNPNFKEAREKLIAAQQNFKGLRLKKENREELFKKIQDAFDSLKERQNADREGFDEEADENYVKIKPVVDDAITFAKDVTNFKQGREALMSAQAAIKGIKLRKEHRDELYAAIRTTFEGLNERQTEEREVFDKETDENNSKLIEQLAKCTEELNNDPEFNKIRDILIAVQGDVKLLKLKREQRNQLFTKIRELFAILDTKRKEYRDNKATDKRNKLNSIYANLQNKIARIEESISWDIKSLNFQKEKLANIDPEEDAKIVEDINNKIAMFDERVKEKEESIADTKKRLEDIQQEIYEAEHPTPKHIEVPSVETITEVIVVEDAPALEKAIIIETPDAVDTIEEVILIEDTPVAEETSTEEPEATI